MSKPITNLLLLTILVLATCKRCKNQVPFSSKLIGRTFTGGRECHLPDRKHTVRILRKRFIYKSLYDKQFDLFECEQEFHFYFLRKTPLLVHLPAITFEAAAYGSETSQMKSDEFCEKERAKGGARLKPMGKTRRSFKYNLQLLVREISKIRDFGCVEDPEGNMVPVEGRSFNNTDVDGIVTYLLGVAYRYKICAEPE